MRLTVHLFGDLRRILGRGQEMLALEVRDGATPLDVFRQLDIHPSEVWIVRANKQIVTEDQPLKEGDVVEIFEPVGGGA